MMFVKREPAGVGEAFQGTDDGFDPGCWHGECQNESRCGESLLHHRRSGEQNHQAGSVRLHQKLAQSEIPLQTPQTP